MTTAKTDPETDAKVENVPPESIAALRSFTLWALETLHLQVVREDEHVYRFFAPEELRGSLNGAGSVRFTFAPDSAAGLTGALIERVTPHSRMFQWILDELRTQPQPLQAVPADDGNSVEQLADPLRSAYRLRGVSLHLADLALERRPVLRVSARLCPPGDEGGPRLRHWHFLPDGTLLDDELVSELGFDQLLPAGHPFVAAPESPAGGQPVRAPQSPAAGPQSPAGGPQSPAGGWTSTTRSDLGGWSQASWQSVQQRLTTESGSEGVEWVASCLVWCQYASGRLVFASGERTAEIAFAGWARRFMTGRELPPPLRCSDIGLESYDIEAADDGHITVGDALETCGHSGRRVLAGQLETCQATAVRVLPEYLTTCPVTGRRVMSSRLLACLDCRQPVDPDNLEQGRCGACRKLATVSKDDPRMARILGEYPKLDRWSGWRLSETGTAYVLTATDWLRRMLVVLQKDSLEVRHLATSGRIRPSWIEVPTEQRSEFFD